MKIAILGTGMVGQAHASKLVKLGHDVMIGTGDVAKSLSRTGNDAMGNLAFGDWYKSMSGLKIGTFTEAATHGEVILNAIKGEMAEAVLALLNEPLNNKIIIDISNPLEFDQNGSVKLFVSNTDSLGEVIQRILPDSKVVKTLNTLNAKLQVEPGLLAGGDHNIFVSGNSDEAKKMVMKYLSDWYGWKNIIDLGDITTARGTESLMLLWLTLLSKMQTPMFNYKIITE